MSERFSPAGQRTLWSGLVLVPLTLLIGFSQSREPRPGPDRSAAVRANNRGIGLMEQYRYVDAVKAFEEAVRRDPDWLAGQINLGIALLNAGDGPNHLTRTRDIFEKVLKKEPDNPHAHFCLGILLMYQKDGREAVKHFQAVLARGPTDAYAWYWLGTLQAPGSKEQSECYRKARKYNRHLAGAIYGQAMNLRRKDPKAAEEFLNEFEALKQVDWANVAAVKFTEMGRYAEVIGRTGEPTAAPRTGPLPRFVRRALKVQLASETRWVKSDDFGKYAVGEVRRLVRKRFGGTMVVLDYNGDGKPDLFLAGAVVETVAASGSLAGRQAGRLSPRKGQVRDLLLRNDGEGRFTDVTAEAGLAESRATLGCCVTDFDNDGKPDLLLTGVGVQKLFRNAGGGKFEDVTAKAGLDKLTAVCLGAAFLDLDHDGALDLLVCEYAAAPLDAVQVLRGEKKPGGLGVYLNVGTEPKVPANAKRPALSCAFRRSGEVPGLKDVRASLTGVTAADLDGDGDLDLLVLSDGNGAEFLRNDRLLRFRSEVVPASVGPRAWNGALVLDADHDGRSDLFLVPAGGRPRLFLSRLPFVSEDRTEWFAARAVDAPPLRQAAAVDLDLDSWTDVVGLSDEGRPILLHNEGGRLTVAPDAFGRSGERPNDWIGLTVCDVNGDGVPDPIGWSESRGLQVLENRSNGNHGLSLELVCDVQKDRRSGLKVRCSADGFGTGVIVQAGDLWAGQENTTLSAGLGQSHQPLFMGLGRHTQPDVVRLRWPDSVRQAELDLPASRRQRIEWKQRKIGW